MSNNNQSKLDALLEKYSKTGQSIDSYLEGLLLSNYLSYWDYVHIDTLLTLQNPKTDFPDEKIFIVYHQITELYFNLCLHELEQISNNGLNIQANGENKGWNPHLNVDFFISRLKRINNYFESLTKSFAIMIEGMDVEQFTKYRMALLPASGFQSAQYRKIELASTSINNLISIDDRHHSQNEESIEVLFDHIYWKKGAIDTEKNTKTYTLQQFEKKYSQELLSWAHHYKSRNLYQKYIQLSANDQKNTDLVHQLRELDLNVNVRWPLVHLKSAVRYLNPAGKTIAATGGTNWRQYLPPKFQKRIFFPILFSQEEIEQWGIIAL